MRAEILTLLRQRGDYVSGQELCERFQVSRTAIWKAVEQLKKEGYQVEAVRNRGYRLAGQAGGEIFGKSEIASRMKTKWIGRQVQFYETIDSTNNRAKQEADRGATAGTLLVADRQTAGRGRRGRVWESICGTNIYFTLILRPEIAPDKTSMLTLVMAHSVAKGIEAAATGATVPPVGIKWPNDIVMDGRKVCGILTEMSMSVEQGTVQYVVIGVGINVHKQQFPEEIAGRAACLDEAFGCRFDRSELTACIMRAFEEDYENFIREGSLAGLQDSYNRRLVNRDREVCVLDPKGEYRGVAQGIDETGLLLVRREGGILERVFAGEVSVRGVYGYV